jgi:hypothetical protein
LARSASGAHAFSDAEWQKEICYETYDALEFRCQQCRLSFSPMLKVNCAQINQLQELPVGAKTEHRQSVLAKKSIV